MGRTSSIVALLAAVLLAGCTGSLKRQPYGAQFISDEYAPYERVGTGRLVGQAFLVQRSGFVVKGAGRTVMLVPVTSISTEWYEKYVVNGIEMQDADDRARQFSRVTQANGDGDFAFEGLPAGEYYVTCLINWQIPAGNITTTEGGIACAKVTVKDGQTTKAVVTR